MTFDSVGPSGIVHYARCWSCITRQCPGGDHRWADDEDIAHAISIGQPESANGVCGCQCAEGPVLEVTEPEYVDIDPADALDLTPCPECGASGACGYDADGRALIHALNDEDAS